MPNHLGEHISDLSNEDDSALWAERRQVVRDVVRDGWSRYRRDAWGSDEYKPISHTGHNLTSAGGVGFGIVDALDLFLMLDLKTEYEDALSWTLNELTFELDDSYSVFETTIRVLGGLLSAYHMMGEKEPRLLHKAEDLASRLAGAFNTDSGIPSSKINLKTRYPFLDISTNSLSEVGTLQLEFRYLSQLTGNMTYARLVNHCMDFLAEKEPENSVYPLNIDIHSGAMFGTFLSIGARADSFYEYLLKQWLQSNGTDDRALKMHHRSTQGIEKRLIEYTPESNLLYVSDWDGMYSTHSMEHLACFYAGHLSLSYLYAHGEGFWRDQIRAEHDLRIGEALGETCYQSYHRTKTGLGPDRMMFRSNDRWNDNVQNGSDPDFIFDQHDTTDRSSYRLRPETIESFFLLWRATGDNVWRERGWEVFQSILRSTKLSDGGYATVRNVDVFPPSHDDITETFFYAETLKYLYLLFGPTDLFPLDRYVFTTEAHPLPIFTPKEGVLV
ncbi:glycoside hydrolase [Piptocephalis cylindrospora]|uniref:alpha-1,2-Mannosidase n=1 Tax=Piptocephalis cylindrospora TaxID=1907219 RepID=A0A4P9Y5V4_9FUNG|nr:glycoside hydrolase [Piptocephalis cylindrospora]|eukprot:RKP14428.1 glycoside hydrolase [Piptocephalis cylindrospora]